MGGRGGGVTILTSADREAVSEERRKKKGLKIEEE